MSPACPRRLRLFSRTTFETDDDDVVAVAWQCSRRLARQRRTSRRKHFNTIALETGSNDAVGLQTGQDDVGEPEGDEDDAGDPLPCFGTTQFRFAEETDVATNQNDDDGYHGADGIQHHGEAQRAGWNVECFALQGKKQKLTVALL